MKKRHIFVCKEIWSVLFITWLFLGLYLIQGSSLTANLTYAPATGGQVSRVDIAQTQHLWYGFFGSIATNTTTNNTLMFNFTNETQYIFRHDIGFEDFCTYGKLIVSTYPNFAPSGLRSISHNDHDLYLGNPPPPLNSANMFTLSRQYNIGAYTLSLYSLELNGLLGYYFQGFGKFGTDNLFYITPTVNHGIGYKGQQANYQILLPRLQDEMTYYFSYDNTDCLGVGNLTEPELEENLTILLSVQTPSRVCLGQETPLLAVDLNKRLYCFDDDDLISQGQCREIADAEIEVYYEDDMTNSIASLTTDDEGLAYFTPQEIGYYTLKIFWETYKGQRTIYVGDCTGLDTLYIHREGDVYDTQTQYDNATSNTTQQTGYMEFPAYLGPQRDGITPSFISTTLTFAWTMLSIPVLLGLCLLYYWHYKDSVIWLLKLRVFVAQAKKNAKMKLERE